MKLVSWVVRLLLAVIIVTIMFREFSVSAMRTTQNDQCEQYYTKALASTHNIGQGLFGENLAAHAATTSAWASLYLACKEHSK